MHTLRLAGRQANNAIMLILVVVSVCFGWYAPAWYMQTPSADEMDLVARVAAGEARGRPKRELEAVCHVMFNRFMDGRWGRWIGVLTANRQFSPMLPDDPNNAIIMADSFRETKAYKRAASACAAVFQGRLDRAIFDPTKGSDHFHSGAKRPRWAKNRKVLVQVGQFRFYRLPRPRTL